MVHLQCVSGIHFNPVMASNTYETPKIKESRVTSQGLESHVDSSFQEIQDSEDERRRVACDQVSRVRSAACDRHVQGHVACIGVEFGEFDGCLLLDSGADISCVSETICRKLDLPVENETEIVINGLGGGSHTYRGMCEWSVMIPGMRSAINVWAVVVEDDAIPACVLLGTPFLRESGIVMDYERCSYRFANGPSFKFPQVDNTRRESTCIIPKVWTVHCVEDQRITKDHSDSEEVLESEGGNQCDGDGVEEKSDSGEPPAVHRGLWDLLTEENLRRVQEQCLVLKRVIKLISKNLEDWTGEVSRFKRHRGGLRLHDGMLMYGHDYPKPVVSFPALVDLTLKVHHGMAHLGREKLIRFLRQHVWHPSLYKCASDVTSTCDACQRKKVSSTQAAPLAKIVTSHPFELFAVDVVKLPKCGPFIGCLVGIDHFTKWLTAVPITSLTGEHIAAQFEKRILPSLVRTPARVLSDNGPEFRSGAFGEVLTRFSIRQQFTTPYRPQGNGVTERANRTLVELLRLEGSAKSWVTVLPRILMTYNTSYQSSIGCSPSEFILARTHDHKDQALFHLNRENWGPGQPGFESYRSGDLVLKKRVEKGKETAGKFEDRFSGPFRILKINANKVTYLLEDVATHREVRAHHSQLRKYRHPPAYILDSKFYETEINGDDDVVTEESDEECEIPVGFGGYIGRQIIDAPIKPVYETNKMCQLEWEKDLLGKFSEDVESLATTSSMADDSFATADGIIEPYSRKGDLEVKKHNPTVHRESCPLPHRDPNFRCVSPQEQVFDSGNMRVHSGSMEDEAIQSRVFHRLQGPYSEKTESSSEPARSPGLLRSLVSDMNIERKPPENSSRGRLKTHRDRSYGSKSELLPAERGIPRRVHRSPVHTRSKGPVRNLPNVQHRTLEYKRRGAVIDRDIELDPHTEMLFSGEE